MNPAADPDAAAFAALAWTPETVERFWRWQVGHPEHYFTRRFGDRIAQRLAPWLAEARSVLDFGCGPGFLVPHLAALGKEVTATDHSDAAIDATNLAFGTVPGFRGAVAVDALVGAARRFDAVVSIEVIEHLSDAQLGGFLNTLSGLLASGGTAIVTTPNDEDLAGAEVFCPACAHTFHRYQHMRSWSAHSLAGTLSTAGLQIVATFATDFSRRRFGDPVGALKRAVKRSLGRPEKRPHLVCIARKV
jgi:2-polyprenyl-3-methyl-5-hydroxy-6-metoxy-1,4-benzoquinol methylase